MKTILSQFCEEFEGRTRPLLTPIDQFVDKLSSPSMHTSAASLVPALQDVRHQLKALIQKVAEQQSYVIIFGPLKSGKSTLMNALAADYVSEVTSLPAYPCMVYVGHAPQREIEITRYDGATETFSDAAAMHAVMEEGHAALADRIRTVEQEGESFEPAQHMPEAIRRVDVRMPAEQLADSGAILVDTPGLYSRMRFGYDLMTREFRDTAASAVFVVKTDNLFLEQVFDEFNELLQLFSRIFLVVNIDSTKRDLQPDGELGPSLEREDPQRIVDAFERLSMGAELKRAWDDGRVGIYPVDLLQAASQRLRGDSGDGELTPPDDFGAFQQGLTDYLNSNDYMVAFLGDSLRLAMTLANEVEGVTYADVAVGLAGEVENQRNAVDDAAALLASVERLQGVDWAQSFDALREDINGFTGERVEAVREKTMATGEALIDAWFESEDSFSDLVKRDLSRVLENCRREIVETTQSSLDALMAQELGGANVEAVVRQDLDTVGFTASFQSGKAAEVSLMSSGTSESDTIDIPVDIVPVSKTISDWLLLRSGTSARQRLLGPDDDPSLEVPAFLKRTRLGEPARTALREAFGERLRRFNAHARERIAGQAFDTYRDTMMKQVSANLAAKFSEIEKALANESVKLDEMESLARDLATLQVASRDASEAIEELSVRYREADPQTLTELVEES